MKKRSIWLAGILLMILAIVILAPIAYWKRTGIRYTVYDLIGKDYTPLQGYFNQIVDIEPDLDAAIPVTSGSEQKAALETTFEVRETQTTTSRQIDAQITAELENSNYTWEQPLAILDPYQNAPLTGVILFTTEEECAVRVTVKGKTKQADITETYEKAKYHRIPVIGLYPSAENIVELELVEDTLSGSKISQNTRTQQIIMETEGMPSELDDCIETVQEAEDGAFPLTVVYGQNCTYPFAFDRNGDIRWYLSQKTGTYGMYMLSNGHFLTEGTTGCIGTRNKPQPTEFYEYDYLGRCFGQFVVPNGAHHEIIEKEPGGNLLCLTSSDLRHHVEDTMVEMDRENGEIVKMLSLADVFGETHVDRVDWAHINTISYQEDTDTVLISARNLHSVIKLNWTTNDIVWILGDPSFWEETEFASFLLQAKGEVHWQYQQHSAYQLAADLDGDPATIEISLFDNHSNTKSAIATYDGNEASYLSVFSVDEKEKTVEQIKHIPVAYSELTSNTVYDEISNHIFGMCGWLSSDETYKGRIYEFDYASEKLLGEYRIRYRFYRANRMKPITQALTEPMLPDTNEVTGSLRPAEPTDKWIFPAFRVMDEAVPAYITGNMICFYAKQHHISQIIFKGKQHRYVYDFAALKNYSKKYLDYRGNFEIPLTNLEADEYQVLCVYENHYYKYKETFTILS